MIAGDLSVTLAVLRRTAGSSFLLAKTGGEYIMLTQKNLRGECHEKSCSLHRFWMIVVRILLGCLSVKARSTVWHRIRG